MSNTCSRGDSFSLEPGGRRHTEQTQSRPAQMREQSHSRKERNICYGNITETLMMFVKCHHHKGDSCGTWVLPSEGWAGRSASQMARARGSGQEGSGLCHVGCRIGYLVRLHGTEARVLQSKPYKSTRPKPHHLLGTSLESVVLSLILYPVGRID